MPTLMATFDLLPLPIDLIVGAYGASKVAVYR